MTKKILSVLCLFVLTSLHFNFSSLPSDDVKFIINKKADGTDKSFKEVMAEFKGKVIYVDFWASWCPPCRQQFPYSKEVHEKMQGKEVVFLYISYDRNEIQWKKGIESLSINGYHWYPSEAQKIEIDRLYKVSGIPRYMIVDKNGKVVDDDAPRPSSTNEVVKKLEALL